MRDSGLNPYNSAHCFGSTFFAKQLWVFEVEKSGFCSLIGQKCKEFGSRMDIVDWVLEQQINKIVKKFKMGSKTFVTDKAIDHRTKEKKKGLVQAGKKNRRGTVLEHSYTNVAYRPGTDDKITDLHTDEAKKKVAKLLKCGPHQWEQC